ncbi:hypothetical protein [uncultured Selenomonas sp.]|uniref:hypothetical protein n=1 Tax=uncultured Selenomonas sp. TaxID=159275 RepID=UPI0025CC2A20|nr:hypothetical protein [uncultured Selenomonas sp.]
MQADLKLVKPQPQTVELQVPAPEGNVPLVTVGGGSYLAGCRLTYDSFRAHLLVGKYTTIAEDVTFIIGGRQETGCVAAYPFFDLAAFSDDVTQIEHRAYDSNHYQILIGNDVTIERQALIEGGVHIGNGAVVRAGAVVREDVPPYAIVEGNPAKVIGYRFPQKIIDALDRIKWWNWNRATILERQPQMEDAATFAETFDLQMPVPQKGITSFLQGLHDEGRTIYVFVLDFGTQKPVWEQVLTAYFEAFSVRDPVFLLLEVPEGMRQRPEYRRYRQICAQAGPQAAEVGEHGITKAFSHSAFAHADVLITNCTMEASIALDFAEVYGLRVVSGCDYDSLLFGKPRRNKTQMVDFAKRQDEAWEQDIARYFAILKQGVFRSIGRKDWKDVFQRMRALCLHIYLYNGHAADDDIEKALAQMDAGVDAPGAYTPKHGEVFFFDGFGEDTRGLALIYLRAIHALGYHLIYCVDRDVRALPLISEVLAANHATVVVLEGKDPCTRYQEITAMIAQYQPEIGFLDTTPWNVESVLAFQHFAGSMKRYQINLTDHAWWPGLASFDTCLEFRDFGAAVSVQERGIPREKLRMQCYYPVIDKDAPFEGFPFKRTPGDFIIFSGGSLYKTKDVDRTFYRIVDAILAKYPHVKFWYASREAVDDDMMWLMQRHPEQFFYTGERKDLYQVIQACDFYMNTSPIIGGLMTQYAAIAGRPPLTYNPLPDPLNGLLLRTETLDCTRQDMEDFLALVSRLIEDPKERERRNQLAAECVMTEQDFTENLGRIMKEGTSAYPIHARDYREELRLISQVTRRNFISNHGENVRKVVEGSQHAGQ